MQAARQQLAGIAVLQAIARQQAAWRAAREVLAEADAVMCLPCNGRPGPCTCGRACLCMHPREAHEHLRRRGGSDCVSCPEGECSRYRRQRRFRLRA